MDDISQINGRMEGGLTLMSDVVHGRATPKRLWCTRVVAHVWGTLGTKASLPGWYITSTSQGNGQSTWDIPTQSISSPFRIFPASVPAISLAWGTARTFTVSQVT